MPETNISRPPDRVSISYAGTDIKQKHALRGMTLHPALRWMMDNIHVRTDPAGNINADKGRRTEKIDGAVGTIMALDRALSHMGVRNESVCNERGLLIL